MCEQLLTEEEIQRILAFVFHDGFQAKLVCAIAGHETRLFYVGPDASQHLQTILRAARWVGVSYSESEQALFVSWIAPDGAPATCEVVLRGPDL